MAITVPYSFTNATAAEAPEVNANFAAIIAKALDKSGDTATGTIAFTGGFNIGSATSAIVVGSQATNDLIRAASATTLGRIATANSSVLATNGSGVPAYTTTLPTGVQDNITQLGTVTAGVWNAGAVTSSGDVTDSAGTLAAVRAGGIAITSQAAYDIIYASSSSQLGRLAKSAGFLQSDGTNAPTLDPTLRSYSETKTAPSIATGVLTLDLSLGNHFQASLNANITTLTISNIPASGKAASFVLVLVADGTLRTVAWPAAVKWADATAPTMTSTLNKTDVFSFLSYDGGTSWLGFIMGQNL